MRNASFTYGIEHKTAIRVKTDLTLIGVLQRLFRERFFGRVAGAGWLGWCHSGWPAPPGLPGAQDRPIFVVVVGWFRWGHVEEERPGEVRVRLEC